MEEIIRQTPSQYIIIRKKGEETEYFSGANIYGRDNDGILRVSKTTWSKTINPMRAPYNQDKMKDILDGMRKYGEIEEEYNYIIAEIQTTTKIVNYIVTVTICGRVLEEWLYDYEKHVIEQYKANTKIKDTIREIHNNVSKEMYCKGIDDMCNEISTCRMYDEYGNVVDVLEIADKLKAGNKEWVI